MKDNTLKILESDVRIAASSSRPASYQFVEMGGLLVSADQGTILKTILGSCVAIVVYDEVRRIGGLIHCLLPYQRSNEKHAVREPARYVDVGISNLLDEMHRQRCLDRNFTLRVVGGANMMPRCCLPDIGAQNTEAARKMLAEQGLSVNGEVVGGTQYRHVELSIDSGQCLVREGQRIVVL